MTHSRADVQSGDVSHLLVAWAEGDKSALDRLMPLVDRELRHLARRQMRRERRDHTLQTTALVNEAYLRLVRQHDAQWQHRSQFFAIAATLMRRILVDHARKRQFQKRAGGGMRITVDDLELASAARASEIVALDDALRDLDRRDKRKARVVELRYFGGLTIEEIADLLGVAPITVKRDWAMAKAWLYSQIAAAPGNE